ncbi:alpha-N-acetylglucosaminidase [Opitutus sp. ER46]|uniref:alpha-N-acetylglucosaminidase n=1 Tax=Opitutus sp. ER46 TaxID=2161864 RepID=UPI001304CD1D|nr:alpha-N-acetylglucosaminidase [Opitutus sp. ER46]
MRIPILVLSLGLAVPAAAPSLLSAAPGNPAPDSPPVNATGEAVAAAEGLIRRVLPGHADAFACEVIPAEDGRDVFEYEALPGGRVVLRGNHGVALAVAFNQYLRREVHRNYDWQAVEPLLLAGPLPAPAAKVRGTCGAAERFFLNYCTFGYTTPWWGWNEWQRFIDWMAMNGINRPLLQCGQEAVWLRVWQSYGLGEDEIRAFFSGPAHLPWHRMANLDRWGGPLPRSYIDGQQALQRQILGRVRALGMKAILSGFAGHVPPELARVRPQAKLTRIGAKWGGMDPKYATTYLDPTDPLFPEIQQRFLRAQTELYGTDHLYAADSFNEMLPPSWDLDYLRKVSRAIFDGMVAVDADARWYQMAWTYYYQRKHWTQGGRLEAFLNAVPTGRLVMLDYVCEEVEFYPLTENFYGQPFIWNYLGNFGGNTHLAAPQRKVAQRIPHALERPNCIGVGSTLEGINVNPGIFELVLEQPWRPGATIDVDAWVRDYAAQRAGGADPAVEELWRAVAAKVLVDDTKVIGRHASIFQTKPPLKGPGPDSRIEKQTRIDYHPEDLVTALAAAWQASPAARQTDGYRYDVVNFTRQALTNRAKAVYDEAVAAYGRKDVAAFRRAAATFLALGRDLDELLATRHEFLLGPWLAQARRWGKDAAEADYYEVAAREIITAWHVPGGGLEDYACRQYNGLMRDYYLPRWEKFFALCTAALENGTAFPQAEFSAWANAASARWIHAHGEGYATRPSGDPVATAERLYRRHLAPPSSGSQ